jgi:hypothetical protein
MPGTVLAIYPGIIYFPSQLTPEIVKDNNYMIVRYDNAVVDGKAWDAKAQQLLQKSVIQEYSGVETNKDALKVEIKKLCLS